MSSIETRNSGYESGTQREMPSDKYGSATNGGTTVSRNVTRQVVPVSTSSALVEPEVVVTKKHEEWTTSKRVVNHKTKQVETRVQRQLILEDGRVVADSGPQVTTKTTEDVRVEETENTAHTTTGDDPPGDGYFLVPGSARVVSEKTESTQVMTESKEENRKLHDEHFRDLSGQELHHLALIDPNDLNATGSEPSVSRNYPGVLTHFSCRSQKVVDKQEVKEVTEMKDGELTTETTRTHHHEEAYDDEVPEDEIDEEILPERSAETTRTIQYYTDPEEFDLVTEQFQQDSRNMTSDLQMKNGNSTHRWLDDHFGSDGSDLQESTRTKAGGNKITIEMSGHRPGSNDLSPSSSHRQIYHNPSLFRSTRNRKEDSREWSPSPVHRTPSPSRPWSPHSRSQPDRTIYSPADFSSSSGSSPSKTPIKTFYLGENNTYRREHRQTTPSLAEVIQSSLSLQNGADRTITRNGRSGTQSRIDAAESHSNTFYRTSASSTPEKQFRTLDRTLPRDRKHSSNSSAIYHRIRHSKSDKNIQVSMSDDDDDDDMPDHRFQSSTFSPHHRMSTRDTMTLPRNTKIKFSPVRQPFLSNPPGGSAVRHSKSSDSLAANNNYYSVIDYGSAGSYKRPTDPRPSHWAGELPLATKRSKSPVYHRGDCSFAYDDRDASSPYQSQGEVRLTTTDAYRSDEHNYEVAKGSSILHHQRSGSNRHVSDMSGFSPHRMRGDRIHLAHHPSPSPPLSPPPRLIRAFPSDRYGSSSSVSPPESPLDAPPSSSSPRRRGIASTASRSKSSGDLRSQHLTSPTSFSPLASPSEVRTTARVDRQKYYRVKPGQDGRSVVVQVREWDGR